MAVVQGRVVAAAEEVMAAERAEEERVKVEALAKAKEATERLLAAAAALAVMA